MQTLAALPVYRDEVMKCSKSVSLVPLRPDIPGRSRRVVNEDCFTAASPGISGDRKLEKAEAIE